MTWQPIETAPKDGSPILVFNPHQMVFKDSVYVCLWEEYNWVEAGGEGYARYDPTHWMPLPQPPEVTE